MKKYLMFVLFLIGCAGADETAVNTDDIGAEAGALLACGEQDPADMTEEDKAELQAMLELPPSELGSLGQPLFHPFGYGSEGGQQECIAPWSGNLCAVPNNKTFWFRMQTSTCPSEWRWDINDLVNKWRDALNARGWNITLVLDGGGFFQSQIMCSTSDTAGAGAVTTISTWPTDYHCTNTQYGERCKYERSGIMVYPERINNAFGWATATSAQKTKFFRSVVNHELGHVAGLGHKCDEGSQLMCSPFPNAPPHATWDQFLTFTPVELQRIQDYIP